MNIADNPHLHKADVISRFSNYNACEYSVIGRWTEPDGTEEWDIIHNGPLTYDEALKIAVKAGRTWDENVPSDRKNLPHREIPIKFEKLQKMIEEERSK